MSKNSNPSESSELTQLRQNLAKGHFVYGAFSLLLIFGTATVMAATVLLSREMITAIIITYLRPVMLQAIGHTGNDAIEWLLTLLRFSPFIFAGLSIGLSFITGALLASPFLATGYALQVGKPWAHIPAIVACIIALPLVPFGTVLSLYTIYAFYKLSQPSTSPVYYR